MVKKIWEELHALVKKRHFGGSEHVMAHRTKKEKETMTQCEMFVTEGIEKADDLKQAGTMLDEGFMAEARAKTMQ